MKPWRNSPKRWNAVCARFARSYWMRRLGCATVSLMALVAAVEGALDKFMKDTSAVTGDGKPLLDALRAALKVPGTTS